MPRFTVKDLLRATTLIAIGAGLLNLPVQFPEAEIWTGEMGSREFWLTVCAGAALIGAGVFTPFGRPWLGGMLGFFAIRCFLIAYETAFRIILN